MRTRSSPFRLPAAASALTLAALLAGCQLPLAAVPPTEVGPAPAPPVNLSDLERRVLVAVNAERQRHGIGPLQANDRLVRAARIHAADMAERGYFEHVSPEGRGAAERVTQAGYAYRLVAENLYRASRYRRVTYSDRADPSTYRYDWDTPEELAARVVRGWMESPGHRRNLLTPEYVHAGVGAADHEHDVYFTLVLATPR